LQLLLVLVLQVFALLAADLEAHLAGFGFFPPWGVEGLVEDRAYLG